MEKLLFIVNPISGGLGKEEFVEKIENHCKKRSFQYKVEFTTGQNDKNNISILIDTYKPDSVVACGGDGTVNMVAEVVKDKKQKLGIIPLGSANGLATEFGVPGDIHMALEIIFKGRTRPLDLVLINDRYYSLHLSDMGLNANLIRKFEKSKSRGKLGYARYFLETLLKKKPNRFYFDSEEMHRSYLAEMVVFANATRYGTGAVVNPIGSPTDGKFEVCVFRVYPWYAIFKLTLLFFTGKLDRSPYVKIWSTKEVTVTTKSKEELQIDGESIGRFKKVNVKINKDKVNLICP